MKVRAMLERYLKEIVPTFAPRTQADYKWHIEQRLMPHFGHLDCKKLKPKNIGQFLDVTTGKISRSRSISVLSACYTRAVGRWYIAEANPCIGVMRNDSKARTRYVTDAEFDAVHALANERLKLAMDLALLTGQRQGDLLDLKWRDASRREVFFQQGKTGKKILIEYTERLWDVLCAARKHEPRMPRRYVIRNYEGERYTSEGFRSCWQRLMKKALEKGVIHTKFTFHDLRAKCVSDTDDITDAMHRAGHTNMAITRGVYDRNTRRVKALK